MNNTVDRASDRVRPERAASLTILVVEDDPLSRRILVASLSRSGFNVLEAADAESARALAAEKKRGIDLLLTDVRMPGMSGTELAEALLLRPDMRTLFISGNPNDSLGRPLEQIGPFLMKPFTPTKLVRKVEEILGL